MSSSLKTISFAHSSNGKWYGVSTDELKALNDLAVKADYNRSISDEGVELLKPDAIHAICLVLADHTNYAGKFSIRAMVKCQMTDSDEPETVCLDISHREWFKRFSKRKSVSASA
jgi:hypothetical protein